MKQIATASTRSAWKNAAASRTDASSSGVTTLPSAATRSTASSRQRRGTSGSGFTQARSNMPGVRIRPISKTSRKPRVVNSPVRAPTFCRIVFDATVVPCTTSLTARGSSPLAASTAATPAATPSPGSSGVVVVLLTWMRPSDSARTTSVNVPPTSTPIRAPKPTMRLPRLVSSPPARCRSTVHLQRG